MAAPQRLLWDRDEYYRLADMGFFQERRVELIDGEIIELPAQRNLHAVGIALTQDALRAAFGPGHWVRVQMSLDLTPRSVPDPDLAVVSGTPRQHAASAGNPTTALLIVEVSDTTLAYDRRRKASLYAASGIEDYWIVNLVDRQLEVHRRPVPDPAQPFRHAYADVQVLHAADRVTPLAAGQATIAVADLLP